MLVNSFDKGAFTPLLYAWRQVALLAGTLLTMSCSQHSASSFTASGYITDNGIVRLWQKNNSDKSVRLFSAFSPWYKNGVTTTAEFLWQGNLLTLIDSTMQTSPPERITIRFDDRGEPSFMQSEINGEKAPLTRSRIALYQYQAEQVKVTSEALRVGRVTLHQGRWHENGTVTTCEGKVEFLNLGSVAIGHIKSRQNRSSIAVSVAWLTAPEGSQLLLVANQDFCRWQPKPTDF